MIDLLLLTHALHSSTGTTTDWCESRGVSFSVEPSTTYFKKTERASFRGVMIFGGDMEVWETKANPWLENEKEFIARLINQKTPLFGVCLGAQLIAEQLGAAVTDMGCWQFGWYPIRLLKAPLLTPLSFHSSEFTLPIGATRTATDATDRNQGFTYGENIRAYQFHTEINQHRLTDILAALSEAETDRAQKKEELLKGFEEHAKALKDWYFSQLDEWWQTAKV